MSSSQSNLTEQKGFVGKAAVAKMYNISISTLQRIIRTHIERFEKIGYIPTQKLLSPVQMQLLTEILGKP